MSLTPTQDAPSEMTVILRALSDPTRLRIYQVLREGEACVCEIAGALSLAENLVSHHLRVLRNAGLVRHRNDATDARWVYYRLDLDTLSRLMPQIQALFDPQTVGNRAPTCGPAAVIAPRRPHEVSSS